MKFRLKLILRTEKFNSSTLVDVVKDENNLIEITRYGYTEPLKNKVDKNNLDEIIKLYEEYLSIILKGKRKFWMSGSVSPEGLLMFGGGIEVKTSELDKLDDLIRFIQLFSRNNQLLYGYFSTEDEYDKKHKIIEGSSVRWEGVSKWDFFEFSPGIHWYTIFGKELVKAIGRDNFDGLVGVTYCKPNDNSLAFHLNDPIHELDGRLSKLESIEKKIGERFFFNKKKDEKEMSHPEAYKKYLKSFGRGY